MAMIVQHNMTAMNANRQLGISTSALAKSTEKLSSGYRINRAADDAAGLAISEKMRSQIRGLDQASTNASDGISMIQTAEGALNESHSILQRMRELAVQAANGTETDEDRGNIQDEIEQLQEELDRIAADTEFNEMKLLDGSLSSGETGMTESGPKYGEYDGEIGAFITSDVADVTVKTTTSATIGGESAIWSPDGKTLTLNLTKNVTYSQTEIDKLIENAKQEDSSAISSPANVTVKFANGIYTAKTDTDGVTTVAGKKATSCSIQGYSVTQEVAAADTLAGNETITFTSRNAGDMLVFAKNEGVEGASAEYDAKANTLTVTLDNNTTYTQADIDKILADAGLSSFSITTDGSIATADSTDAKETNATAKTGNTTNGAVVASRFYEEETTLKGRFTSTIYNTQIAIAVAADTEGKETAVYTAGDNKLTLTLETGRTYTQAEIDALMSKVTGAPVGAEFGLLLDDGALENAAALTNGVKAKSAVGDIVITEDANKYVGANVIQVTSNKYGADHNVQITLDFTAAAGKEEAVMVEGANYDMTNSTVSEAVISPAQYRLSLQSGKEYTAQEIEALLGEAGLDVSVRLAGNETRNGTDEPNTLFVTRNDVKTIITLSGGAGIGDEDAFLTQNNYGFSALGGGIVLQVGANEGQTMRFSIDDMSAASLGVNGSKVDVSTQIGASNSLGNIDEAIAKVSKQRSLLGAVQNRLEHTISNLDNTAENLQAAESGIRDADMADEMVTMSKYNILQQAGQSMLAQANQATQGVLSLLQG